VSIPDPSLISFRRRRIEQAWRASRVIETLTSRADDSRAALLLNMRVTKY